MRAGRDAGGDVGGDAARSSAATAPTVPTVRGDGATAMAVNVTSRTSRMVETATVRESFIASRLSLSRHCVSGLYGLLLDRRAAREKPREARAFRPPRNGRGETQEPEARS